MMAIAGTVLCVERQKEHREKNGYEKNGEHGAANGIASRAALIDRIGVHDILLFRLYI
jgi:hypothetical protein